MNENKNKRKLGERSRGFDFWWCGESGFIFPLHVFICSEIKFELNPLVFFKLKWVKWPWYKFPLPSTFHFPFWTPGTTIRYEDLPNLDLQLPIWRSSTFSSPTPNLKIFQILISLSSSNFWSPTHELGDAINLQPSSLPHINVVRWGCSGGEILDLV